MKLTFKSATEFALSDIPLSIAKVIEACKKMPDGELVDKYELSTLAKIRWKTLNSMTGHPALKPYKAFYRNKNWFGNTKTIAELRKQQP